jgi:hypothetical protein
MSARSIQNAVLQRMNVKKLCIPVQNTVKPLLTDLYGENHGSDKPISQMSEGKGNVDVDMKK